MQRDIPKLIEAYKRRYSNTKRKEPFFYSDLEQIKKLSRGDLYTAIVKALEAGYMVGYRRAKRELRGGAK